MIHFGSCPRCQLMIPEERLKFKPVVCPVCGYVESTGDTRVDAQLENKFIKFAIIITLILIAGFIQAASWDKYALEIVPLKFKSMTGMASPIDLDRITEICKERLKHDCVEDALQTKAFQYRDNEALAQLGHYQNRRGKFAQAANNLKTYFANGGLDLEASYQYAKALERTKQIDLASNFYEQVLRAKPETLQITVTQDYVKMLMDNGRHAQALGLIEAIRKTSPSANLFMESEVQKLKQAVIK